MATYNIGTNFAVIAPSASAGKQLKSIVFQPNTATTRWGMLQPIVLNGDEGGGGGVVRPASGIVFP